MSPLIHLEKFEGPLALLLHLIRKEEMDIFDINIHQITTQYLEHVKAMRHIDLENAGEFVALAATLIHIKSRLLLPQYNESGEEVEAEDPRQELVRKLVEYQKYQDAAKRLYERPLLGRDLWVRGQREEFEAEPDNSVAIEENALFGLISAYRRILKHVESSVHKVSLALQSVSSRILELRQRLSVGQQIGFSELITIPVSGGAEARSNQILVTFLSLLELARMGFVSLFQSEQHHEIHIETKMPIERDVVVRVESYDGSVALPFVEAPQIEVEEVATDEEIFAEEHRLKNELKETIV